MNLYIDNISKQYNDSFALSEIELEINSGDILCVTGPNGSGKSTLIKILSTLIKPTSGNVYLDGYDIYDYTKSYLAILGYLAQDVPVYPNLTAFEFLSYISALKGINHTTAKQQINSLLEIFNLSDVCNKHLSELSGGMIRRVGISCAFLGDPKIIILDEPNAGLDLEERLNLRNFLKKLSKNRIILLSSHITSDIEFLATHLALLNNGELYFYGLVEDFMGEYQGNIEHAYISFLDQVIQ